MKPSQCNFKLEISEHYLFPPKRKYRRSSLPKTIGDECTLERNENTDKNSINANSSWKYEYNISKMFPLSRTIPTEDEL